MPEKAPLSSLEIVTLSWDLALVRNVSIHTKRIEQTWRLATRYSRKGQTNKTTLRAAEEEKKNSWTASLVTEEAGDTAQMKLTISITDLLSHTSDSHPLARLSSKVEKTTKIFPKRVHANNQSDNAQSKVIMSSKLEERYAGLEKVQGDSSSRSTK